MVMGRQWTAWAWRLALLALLWWALSAGDPRAWRWGLPAIVATALLMPAPGAWRWRLLVALTFLPQALMLSLRGGMQVARLACRGRLALDTRVIEYPWQQLPEGPARLFMASLINLVPGTLTLRLTQDALHVHVLHHHDDTSRALARLEQRIARLYGVTPPRWGRAMISQLYVAGATLLLINAGVGIWRIWRGPTSADRMLAAELISTSAIAVLLLLSTALDLPALVDVALLFALLAAIATANFVTRTWTLLREDGSTREEARRD